MYWVLDVHRYRKGFAHSIEDSFYFRNKALAEKWLTDYNSKNTETVARDLREEKEETLAVVLGNYFKTSVYQDRVSQKDLYKFCGI